MKKLKLFLACVLMTIFSIGQVWADVGDLYYTFTPQKPSSGAVSDYTKTGDQTVDGMTWNVPGNWYGTGALRIGGKSISEVNRTITGKSQMGDAIAQIVITHQGVTSDNLVLNSVKLTKASNSAFSSDVETKTLTKGTDFTYSKNAAGTITFTPAGDSWAKDSYYKFDFNISNSNSSNYAFVINKIEFYSFEEAAACSNTVAITKGAETNGTYTLSATSVCGDGDGEDVTISDITPAAGYEFDEITTSASGTVDNVNKKVTGITAATTITVKFKELPKYTVSFSTGAGNPAQADIAETVGGAGITLPDGPTPACSPTWTFAGWAEAAVGSETTTAPTLLSGTYHPTSNVTLYAVYKRTESGGGESGTVTITRDSENFPTAYGDANTFTEYTLEGYKFKIQQVYATGSGDNKKMQWRASGNSSGTGTIYNTQTYPAKISSIVLTYHSSDGNKNHTLKVGNTENPTGGTEITGTTLNGVETFDCSSANADYFVLANGANAGYTISFAINYGAASTTYYLSAPSCSTPTCSTPVISGTTPFLGSSEVTITCGTDGAAIYYTTNGDEPTSGSTLYEGAFNITEACTVKAIAIKDGYDNSAVASKEFEKIVPLTTMDEIFSAASSAGNYYITFSDAWVVTGVSTNGKNVYISDGTKGMILYNNSANMELAVGNTLSGTVQRSLTLYNGAAELTGFTTEGLTRGTADLPAVQVLDAEGVAALSGVNTGSLIKISGAATQSGTKYYVAGVQLYNALSTAYTNPTADKNYYVTGVYAQYNTTKEVMPRSAADIEEMKYQLNYILPAQGTLSIKQNETLVSSGTKWVEGTEFTLSSTAPSDDYKAGVYTVTDWGEPANDVTADVLSGNTLTMPKYNVIVTVAFPEKAAAPISWSNSGAAVNVHIDNTDDLPTLTKGEFTVTCNSSDENVATVDNDGVVTMVGAGTTTISAVFAGNDDYKATTVSYELTVLPDFYVTGTAVGGWDSDKVPVAGTSYTIKNLAAGSYKLKITIDGTWDTAKGFSDLTASEVIAGLYNDNDGNICFTLKAAGDVVVTYTGEVYKLAGNFEPQAVKVKGGWDSWTEHAMALSDDKKSASVTVALPAAENVEFGIQINTDDFRANGYNYHRGYTGTAGITGNTGNMKLTSDIAGDYTFTWTFGTNAMNITFPLKEAGLSWGVDAATAYTVGKEYELPTLSNPNNLENVSYESSAPAVATIAADGTITLVGTGSTVITATSEATSVYKAGVATYTLTVSAPTSVAVSGSCETDYEKGADFVRTGLVATAKYDDASELDVTASATWTNSLTDNKVNAAGDVTVTAEWQGLSGNKVVTVSLLAHELTFNAPTNGTLVVEYNDAEVATGEHFLKGDVLTITATADPGYKLTSLTVNEADFVSGNNYTVGTEDIAIVATFAAKAAAGLSWGVDAATAYTKGKSYELPTLSNPNGLLVELSSSNEAVAYLDEGQLKIAGAGTATITATSVETGVYAAGEASYTLNVYGPAALAISGEATKTSYEKGDAFDRTGLVASVLYGDASVLVVTDLATWTADPATVTANGNVTVTAEWEGLSDDEEVAVTVKTHKVTFKDYDEDYHVYLSVWNGETQISSGDEFAKGTVLTVEVELESADYVLATLTANTTDIKATKQFTIGEVDVTIAATTEQKPLAPISWSAESASIAMNGDVATLPTLVNELGLGIRYMSNNEEAATIDENTGVITLVGAGVTTITAQSIATEEGAYRTTFVTYTLTVVAIPTALDNAEAGEKAQKIMLNNQLFILRGGKIYDAQGKLVK